jgi:threonine dehydratase
MDNVDAASDGNWASDVVSRAAALNLHAFINMPDGMVVLS